MIFKIDIKFKAENEEKALLLNKAVYGFAKDKMKTDGRTLTFSREIMSEEELDEAQYYIEELPHSIAEKNDINFDYEGNLDLFDDYVQIQIEYCNGKYRFQNIEEEAYYIGEKKDGKIRLRGADEDEYAMFLDF